MGQQARIRVHGRSRLDTYNLEQVKQSFSPVRGRSRAVAEHRGKGGAGQLPEQEPERRGDAGGDRTVVQRPPVRRLGSAPVPARPLVSGVHTSERYEEGAAEGCYRFELHGCAILAASSDRPR